jgi:L-seryl-tRNA(Ser) seleniumtransferase
MDPSRVETPPAPPALRELPSVDFLLRQSAIVSLLDEYARPELLCAIRAVLDRRRAAIVGGAAPACDVPALALDVRQELYERSRPALRRVINATGVVLHTGLGRAPLPDEAVQAIAEIAAGYCNLELDLASGQRGDRHDHVRRLLTELTGAEEALVVNNNAAATYLALASLAARDAVVVSRGQLVEIGGSYRMPEIMAAAGCRMIEVGTTNRTRISDYESALFDGAVRVLLHVHTSNYRIQGFVETVPVEGLVALARRYATRKLYVIDDLGSGLLDRPEAWLGNATVRDNVFHVKHVISDEAQRPPESARTASWDEPTVRESVSAGAELTLFSGDKLLGGPQAGIIVGRRECVAAMRGHPLMRTLRPDKLTLAALEATLRLYRDPAALLRKLPVLRMLVTGVEELEARARSLERALREALPAAAVEGAADESYAGGGSLPTLALPTWTVRIRLQRPSAGELAAGLRRADTPVICRVRDGAAIFDCRTISDSEVDAMVAAVAQLAGELGG